METVSNWHYGIEIIEGTAGKNLMYHVQCCSFTMTFLWKLHSIHLGGRCVAWWLRHQASMPEVMGSIPAHVRPHSNTLRQGMNPWLLLDCTESGSIGTQNVQHLEIRWRFNGVLSPESNVRLEKSCEWLPQPVQDCKPIPLPLSHCCIFSLITKCIV